MLLFNLIFKLVIFCVAVIICIANSLEFSYVWYFANQAGYLNGDYVFIAINIQYPG